MHKVLNISGYIPGMSEGGNSGANAVKRWAAERPASGYAGMMLQRLLTVCEKSLQSSSAGHKAALTAHNATMTLGGLVLPCRASWRPADVSLSCC